MMAPISITSMTALVYELCVMDVYALEIVKGATALVAVAHRATD